MISDPTTFRNPILERAADPWVLKHTDGFYYFMFTEGDRLSLVRSASLSGIGRGRKEVIWKPDRGGRYSCNLWAPEIHWLDNKWYIYYTANDGGGDDTRRICVLENADKDPLAGQWVWKGALRTPLAGLDGTVLTIGGKHYFLYAGYGHYPDYGTAIFMMRMANPYTLQENDHILLTAPTLDWEKRGGMAINEGPAILHRNGRIFVIYSASTTWSEDYCLGMLTMDESSDPMDPASWTKSARPVFCKSVENKVFATGHNSFTVSPDGKEDWIVYHAMSSPGLDTELRATRIQKFDWHADGTPNFGIPLSDNHTMTVPSGE